MNDEQKARVIANCETMAKALREGLPLEFNNLQLGGGGWHPELYAICDVSPHLKYRIKPEPRTIWVNEYKDHGYVHSTPEKAKQDSAGATRIAVEYREVVK